jgi:hypothetical protein
VTAAKHSAPQDPSFRRSLLRNAGGALGLVVLVAAMFGVLGMIGREDAGIGLADGNEDANGDDEAPSEVPEPPDEEPPPAEDPGEAPEGEGSPDGDESADEAAPEETEEAEVPAEAPDEDPAEAPSEPAIDPSTVSVQVLDGYRQDGGAAATAVFEQLQDAGYNIIARNPAIAYDVTTVLWTAGHEEEGRQVAQAIGADEVREQPGNLSTQVNVHVVVGADRG